MAATFITASLVAITVVAIAVTLTVGAITIVAVVTLYNRASLGRFKSRGLGLFGLFRAGLGGRAASSRGRYNVTLVAILVRGYRILTDRNLYVRVRF